MRTLLLLLPLLAVLACEESVAEPIDLSADLSYFPTELNRELIYDVDSIVLFNTVSGVVYDTARSQVRETLVESFEATDGTTTFRGERWRRADATDPWRFEQTFTVTRSNRAATRTEDNLTFTKLIFPIRARAGWEGHAAFDETRSLVVGGEFLDVYNNWSYRYATATSDTLINGQTYEASWRVDQADIDNLIDRRIAFERYAPGVGLIERFLDARHTQCQICCGGDTGATCLDLPWDEKAEKGFILHQVIRGVR